MNRESERQRLVELIDDFFKKESGIGFTEEFLGELADKLLNNGIVVPPVKVGDAIFRIDDKQVFDWWDVEHIEIYADEIVYIDDSGNQFTEEDIGKTVFTSREEAEKALERKEDGKNGTQM